MTKTTHTLDERERHKPQIASGARADEARRLAALSNPQVPGMAEQLAERSRIADSVSAEDDEYGHSDAQANEVDPRDLLIARLRQELAETRAQASGVVVPGTRPPLIDVDDINSNGINGYGMNPSMVFEPLSPHAKAHRAASKHLHYTCAELDRAVRSNEVHLDGLSVLCSDGWYINPYYKS